MVCLKKSHVFKNKISKFFLHNLWETIHVLFCILNYGNASRRFEMRKCFSFFPFLNQFFNENREELLLLMENVSQKNTETGRKPILHWSPSAPAKASSSHHKNIIALRQIFRLAGSPRFLFSVWITQKVVGEMLCLWLSVKSINRVFLFLFFFLF